MNFETIGRIAYERHRKGEVPDHVIVRELAAAGITGRIYQPEYRDAYEACEREWRRLVGSDPRRLCARDGCSVEVLKYQRKYCSRECWRAVAGVGFGKVTQTCPVCEEDFEVRPSEADRRVNCSEACYAEAMKNQVTVECRDCGADFEVRASRAGRITRCERCREERRAA